MIAGKWPIQGVWGDLFTRVAGMWYLSATAPPTSPLLQPPRPPFLKERAEFYPTTHTQTGQ